MDKVSQTKTCDIVSDVSVAVQMTMEDICPKRQWPIKTCLAVISACMGSFCMGAAGGWTSPALPNLNANHSPFHTDDEENSWIGGILPLSALFGGLLGGPYMDKMGRKLSCIVLMIPCSIGWLIIVASSNVACMYVGRAVTGVCVGAISCIIPVYIGEISPPGIRGVLGSCHQLFICCGVLYVYVCGSFLSWTWLSIACSVFCCIFAMSMALMPESPRWLMNQGRKEAAEWALQWLNGKNADVCHALKELEESSTSSKENASLKEFLKPVFYRPLLISFGLMFFQQSSGVNVILFFTVYIFNMANSTMDPNLETVIVGIVGVVGTLVSIAIIDLAGRKILLFCSGLIVFLSMTGMGVFFYLKKYEESFANNSLTWLPLTCLIVFSFGFNVAYGPIPWLMMGEIFPAQAKGFACGVATGFNWLCAFIITKFFVNISAVVGIYGAFWLMAASCFLSLIFVVFLVPETKGKTLEDIEKIFKGQ